MNEIIKQFTGIADKNGKNIYVGDILRVTYGDANSNFTENELVIYKDEEFMLNHQDGQSSLYSNYFSIEVIGNIEDNPDLFTEGFRMSFAFD